MDDALCMRGFHGRDNLARYRQCLFQRQRALRESIRQRGSVDQLHDQSRARRLPRARRRLFEAINGGDVRVIERRENLRLAAEAGDAVRRECEGGRKNLQRNVATELRVARLIDLAHSAGADGARYFVRTDASAGRERHGRESVGGSLVENMRSALTEGPSRSITYGRGSP